MTTEAESRLRERIAVEVQAAYETGDTRMDCCGRCAIADVVRIVRRSATEPAPRKSDLPAGSVVWIGERMAVKRAGQTDEGYAWRYVDTGELVDYDNVYKCMWTMTDPAASVSGLGEGEPQ